MFTKALFVFSLLISSMSYANFNQPIVSLDTQMISLSPSNNWVPGDRADYKMSIGSFLKGEMMVEVLAYDNNGLLIRQMMDLKVMKQDCEILIDPGTGETKSMVCNGQNQDPGQQDVEIIETKQVEITVPAGTFEAIYVKALERNQNQEIEQWVNPYDIPVMGLLKMLTDSQFGEVKAELTSFVKK